MYEFHGWITLKQSPRCIEEDPSFIAQEVKAFLTSLHWDTGLLDLRVVNGNYYITTNGYSNHKSDDILDIFKMYRFIAQIAPGSYGILYAWDDEDTDGLENQFQAYVLKRGTFERKSDAFLSPCIPTIEDAYAED